jgi:hypothetical protein
MSVPFPLPFELTADYDFVVAPFMGLLSKPLDESSNYEHADLTVDIS